MAKRKTSKNRKPIPRQTRKFQLRLEHKQDSHVREILDFAKSQRREVTLIRDAVSLFWALENGNLDALFEQFPQYKAQLAAAAPTGGQGGAGGNNLAKEIAEHLALIGGSNYVMQSALPAPAIPLPAVPKAVVKAAKPVSSDEIANNMLAALDMFG